LFWLHSDEIYANSIFRQGAGFVSMATVLAQSPPELQHAGAALVHTVFGLSKDWRAAAPLSLQRHSHMPTLSTVVHDCMHAMVHGLWLVGDGLGGS
jgi:hypothetical protein